MDNGFEGIHLTSLYGENINRHPEHESVLRRTRVLNHVYKNSGFFNKCQYKESQHACLDQLSGDGNIQFKDPIP